MSRIDLLRLLFLFSPKPQNPNCPFLIIITLMKAFTADAHITEIDAAKSKSDYCFKELSRQIFIASLINYEALCQQSREKNDTTEIALS